MKVDLKVQKVKNHYQKTRAVNYNRVTSTWDKYVRIGYTKEGKEFEKMFLLWLYESDKYAFFLFQKLYLLSYDNTIPFVDLDLIDLDKGEIKGITYENKKINENELENETLKLLSNEKT
jgi:hypothetical protein